MTADILTFGCRLNAYESEVMRGHAAGLPDTMIVNTCAVTAEAERQARQAIRRAARERPGAREALEQHARERVDVGARVDGSVLEALRRHVVEGA